MVSGIPPFSRVLVANRGEIAVRIMRTCRELGIATAAVYSTADADALHVQVADEAYCLGPPPALESYLNVEAILRAARESGAEAVHPGYGFLAESPDFARAVVAAGLAWVGPPPDVISLLGDKVVSKRLSEKADVPVIPGYNGEDQGAESMREAAERIGYPIMIKSAAGGGGKGMRIVERPQALDEALAGAARESRAAFGDDRVFLEKLLVRPRHIEIQVLADSLGNAVYLGERECSVQRRHQKVFEETPSAIMTRDLRDRMGAAALRIARSAGYVNAGTVEFLFAGDNFYFLEVNTRLQVEHPVTEMVTGYDLVGLQLEIAAGRALPFGQLDIELHGHAIEARLYAEDPEHDFAPATGALKVFLPPLGPGLRNDVGVFEGAVVTPYYDPLLAKLIVHAESREVAVARLHEALEQYVALGVTTNLSFLHWTTGREDFVSGRIDTGFVDRVWEGREPRELPTEVLEAAAAFELSGGEPRTDGSRAMSPWQSGDGWRPGGAARTFMYRYGERTWTVQASKEGMDRWKITVDGAVRTVRIRRSAAGIVVLHDGPDTLRFAATRVEDDVEVAWCGWVYRLSRASLLSKARSGPGHSSANLTAPMPGTVVKVAVVPGQQVAAQEPLIILEAMKMEHVIHAPHAGVVEDVLFREGDLVPAGSPVVRLAES